MATLGVKLPITKDSIYGYTMIDDLTTLLRQNFKMLVLTNPGERVMIPEYGVGIRQYLFENYNASIESDIEARIRDQVKKYLPVITINRISFEDDSEKYNTMHIKIQYSIPALSVKDLLEFTI